MREPESPPAMRRTAKSLVVDGLKMQQKSTDRGDAKISYISTCLDAETREIDLGNTPS
jgi:hypothetical protein